MAKHLIYIILTMLLFTLIGNAQDTNYGPGYRNGMQTNPAFSGVAGDGQLSLTYYNFYPGKGFNLNSFFMSYDSYVPVLHGGTGFYLSNDLLGGIIRDLKAGIGYAYHLKVDKDFFINAGLTASVINRGLNRGQIILPDQIDPLGGPILQSAEVLSGLNHTVIDIGVGFLVSVKNISGGISLNHFAEPDISGTRNDEFRLKRKYAIQLLGTFNNDKNEKLTIMPVASFEIQGDHYSGALGSALRYNLISINSVFFADKEMNINLQTGFSLLTGKFVLYYNYKFNLVSTRGQFPFSLLHQAGVMISLNIVDKRKIIKTINFPEL